MCTSRPKVCLTTKNDTELKTLIHRNTFISTAFNIITTTAADVAIYSKAAICAFSVIPDGLKQMTPVSEMDSDIN
jgi:hypothetical protein